MPPTRGIGQDNKEVIVLVPVVPRVIRIRVCLVILADGPAVAAVVGGSVSPASINVSLGVPASDQDAA